ncbi:DUF5701 family protein [soil metagenome]
MPTMQELPQAATLTEELDRQLETLVDKGYPTLAGLDEASFADLVHPLRARLHEVEVSDESHLPFVLVVRSALVPTVGAVEQIQVDGKVGWTDMQDEIADYRPIAGLEIPDAEVYLLVDVSTGPETLNVRPVDALGMIRAAGRTPLTADEGVALLTQFPDVLTARNAFQTVGSRAANKRIPSFWVSKGAPRLGWCWAGNPHTWLGSGSAMVRLSA